MTTKTRFSLSMLRYQKEEFSISIQQSHGSHHSGYLSQNSSALHHLTTIQAHQSVIAIHQTRKEVKYGD